MPGHRSALRSPLALLLLIVMLSACATHSTPTPAPPPVRPPEIPAPPAVTPPPPSGSYWARYCQDIERLSLRLKITLPTSEGCLPAGPGLRAR